MKHLIALTLIVFIGYFGWYYLPSEAKDALRKFRGTHLFKVVALFLLVWLAFMTQAIFGSGKIF
jgi:hypothetical protein